MVEQFCGAGESIRGNAEVVLDQNIAVPGISDPPDGKFLAQGEMPRVPRRNQHGIDERKIGAVNKPAGEFGFGHGFLEAAEFVDLDQGGDVGVEIRVLAHQSREPVRAAFAIIGGGGGDMGRDDRDAEA